MTSDLSAFYFDIRKDVLYCDPISSVKRKASLTVIDHLFRCTVTGCADAVLHGGECWAALRRRRQVGASRDLPEVPVRGATTNSRKMAQGAHRARRRHRRLEIERAQSASARRWRRIRSCTCQRELYEAVVDVDLAESASPGGDAGERRRSGDAFRLPDVAACGEAQSCRGRKCARSWKDSSPRSAPIPIIRTSRARPKALREWDTCASAE